VCQFKLSNDPHFAAKLHEIADLYVDPPDHGIALSVDETNPGPRSHPPRLPMKKGTPEP
jgi:hypothetical protein